MFARLNSRLWNVGLAAHFNNPQNVVGSMPRSNYVGTAIVGAPECGYVTKLQIKVATHGLISAATFKTFGCGVAIASSSFMAERLTGMPLTQGKASKMVNIMAVNILQLIVYSSRQQTADS
ncbi:FeS cluster assembly scaffold IscU [Mycena leptocephala]|nr:FeS cluster assembly scaffold IscU [Mycena leptocephala]